MKAADRLFLQKDKGQDIYVDLPKPLLSHQLDGIRFLYRQYKKKSPGVIVNDPAGYGKCLQVVLFLKASRLVSSKPILILTHSVDLWRSLFAEWTDVSATDIKVCSEDQYASQVMINPVEDGPRLGRRAWGILVLHNSDQINSTTNFLRMNFNAQYKIWITSEDMKENLHLLSTVYEWLYPEQRFNVESFTARKDDWKDKIQKMIFLDAFLEDVLLRRLELLMHLQGKIDIPATTVPEKTSRKNKDPTGTKVKKSKKRRIVDDDEETLTIKRVLDAQNELAPDKEERMDIEDFIGGKKSVSSIGFQNIKSIDKKAANVGNVKDRSNSNSGGFEKTGVKTTASSTDKTKEDIKIKEESLWTESNIRNEAARIEIAEMEVDNDTTKVIVPESENDSENSKNNKSIGNTTFIPETEDSENTKDYECSTLKWEESPISNYVSVVPNDKNSAIRGMTEDLLETSTLKYEDNTENTCNGSNEQKDTSKEVSEIELRSDKDNHDNTNSKTKHDNTTKRYTDDMDAELAAFEAKALQRLKGSILDRIF